LKIADVWNLELLVLSAMKILLFALVLLGVCSCTHLKEQAMVGSIPPERIVVDTAMPDSLMLMPASVRAFYERRNFQPVWNDSNALLLKRDSLVNFIFHSELLGLDPENYHAKELRILLNDSTPNSKAKTDLLLTDAFFGLRSHLSKGRIDPLSLSLKDTSHDVDSVGIRLLLQKDFKMMRQFSAFEPTSKLYQLLKDSLSAMLAQPQTDSVWQQRLETLKINLERLRISTMYPRRYMRVNLPSFMLQVIEDDSVVLRSAVIVGKPESQTPLLQGSITSFIIYPYWHVPKKIALTEYLPLIQKDSSYLRKHNFDVLDKLGNVLQANSINWASLNENNFPYILRQRDGSENALGILKFMFQNPYNVYLHDTNAKKLFSKKMRALSHGCVRVQKATDLAMYLVKDDSIYVTPDDLVQYLSIKQKYKVQVRNPIPLFIEYQTCDIVDGKLRLYEDIYGIDRQWTKCAKTKKSFLQ
jgi:murein L,D-transpeptidase YcbB/YkuD